MHHFDTTLPPKLFKLHQHPHATLRTRAKKRERGVVCRGCLIPLKSPPPLPRKVIFRSSKKNTRRAEKYG
uniref:Uncharacterized protein n=1 Tax=Siphoviridae sp. ct33S22 TaxID=2826279 RepID=A0A8S5QLE0_9CAUD|nr:MAG TPA: hypothetical protein [Siphoviridae sp. ct33S22]